MENIIDSKFEYQLTYIILSNNNQTNPKWYWNNSANLRCYGIIIKSSLDAIE
jgi:hypothetical protein